MGDFNRARSKHAYTDIYVRNLLIDILFTFLSSVGILKALSK